VDGDCCPEEVMDWPVPAVTNLKGFVSLSSSDMIAVGFVFFVRRWNGRLSGDV